VKSCTKIYIGIDWRYILGSVSTNFMMFISFSMSMLIFMLYMLLKYFFHQDY